MRPASRGRAGTVLPATVSVDRAKRSGVAERLAAIVAALAVVACAPDASGPFTALPPAFEVERLASIFNVDDAGVGDLDGDGRPDLWTTNHSARQWVALANADGGFTTDGVGRLGLYQDLRVPGVEPTLERPGCNGLHQLYLRGTDLFIAGGPAVATPFEGELYLPWPAEIDRRRGALWEPLGCEPALAACTRGRFKLAAGGSLRARMVPPRSDGFPITTTLDSNVPLSSVALGEQCIRPSSHAVTFELKDRHGLLLADLTGDGHTDLFISRGGARGRLEAVNPGATDELWTREPQGWQLADQASGITKQGCPGRQIGAFDVDGDGDLDIYQVCGRAEGDNASSRNRLYVQMRPGHFEEQSASWGLALDGAGSFAWVPARAPQPDTAGSEPRLIWVTADAVTVLARRDGRYQQIWREPRRGTDGDAVLVAPPRADGSVAVALLGGRGNSLLTLLPRADRHSPSLHRQDVVELQSFAELGLPATSSSGNWVDLAGDGRFDLFLVPQGLFRGDAGSRWQPTGQFALDRITAASHSSWFDADGDGDLDLWLLLKDERLAPRPLRWPLRAMSEAVAHKYTGLLDTVLGPMSWEPHVWEALLVRNRRSAATHLALTIAGPRGNAEGVGTAVTATIAGAVRRGLVGAPNGARLSQTQHTVYLGIAGLRGSVAIEEVHSDGQRRRYRLRLPPATVQAVDAAPFGAEDAISVLESQVGACAPSATRLPRPPC